MTYANAVTHNQTARTANGMKAIASTGNPLVEFFYNAAAMRGRDIVPLFSAAYAHDKDKALRLAQWLRDVRGGAGERKLFRDIINYLETVDAEDAAKLLFKAPEIGRWDDVIETPKTEILKEFGFMLALDALREGNKLTAKWMPRKGELAKELRKFYGLNPRDYRKALVAMTQVVETQMCAKQWNEINFSHVPSLAHSRYRKAFKRNAEQAYANYATKLEKGDPTVKINASAVYPYDVLRDVLGESRGYGWAGDRVGTVDAQVIEAQWKALPNYLGEDSILPIVDTSGSMETPISGSNVTCLQAAQSLGLYCADKLQGAFKDLVVIFSRDARVMKLTGNSIVDKARQLMCDSTADNTNLYAAFKRILEIAQNGNVAPEDMPKMLLIMSDMQFDSCVRYDDSAMQMITRKYQDAGYAVPKVVFWNLNAYGNAPASAKAPNVGLVSGFSPAIMKSVLAAEDFTPYGIMLKTIMKERYDV